MSDWKTIDSAPKDGTWILLKGGKIVYGWYEDTQPPCVCGQWASGGRDIGIGPAGNWQFAWYDSGYYGEYEEPTHWAEVPR